MERIKFDREQHKETFRRFALPSSAIRFAVEGDGKTVKGYAAVWGVLSSDRGGYLACFPKGSMVLPDYAVTLQYNHNDDFILATEANGGLVVTNDDYGAGIEATLDDTYIDDYVAKKIAKGVIQGMSLGMFPIRTHREERLITLQDAAGNPELAQYIGQALPVEVYDEWLLDEVTITGIPAFPQTSIGTFAKEENGKEGFNKQTNELYIMQANILGMHLDD